MTARRRVTICDYGAGNLHSLQKALATAEIDVRIDADPLHAIDPTTSDALVLPGVGAFSQAAEKLAPAREAIRTAAAEGFPVLGICLGMQLFVDTSEEGKGEGLGLLQGTVRRLRAARVPQIGWNDIEHEQSEHSSITLPPLAVAYYANSYVCELHDSHQVSAWSVYDGDRFPAAVVAGPRDNVVGVQFHPEKSSANGVGFLRELMTRLLAAAPR
jgi:glutamine amidotransferase